MYRSKYIDMKKANELKGLSYRGSGYLLYNDESSPRLSNLDVAKRVGGHLGKRVEHIGRTPHIGFHSHTLQYTHLYNKDVERSAKKLANKFNNK